MMLVLLSLALVVLILVTPVSIQAQPATKVPRVGILLGGKPGDVRAARPLVQGLSDLGYVEGRNTAIEYCFANGPDRFPNLALQLARLEVDVIVTAGNPVGDQLIRSFARPLGT